ncbi:MAG TPA: (Fe-S)-binding protein [Anaeromyxobacteraceae bacterium]|nr:(Fe-S)-binding protein [Anaeromyxobacteraceae bacterium]
MGFPLLLASREDLRAIGVEPAPEAERIFRAVQGIDRFRKSVRSLSVMLDSCTSCGACASACHSFLGTEDPLNIPAARAGLFRKVYARHFTWAGKIAGLFRSGRELDEKALGAWLEYFYQCNACRRCATVCPFGIDTGEITLVARYVLTGLGIAPRFMVGIGKNELKVGNNMGLLEPAIRDSCAFLEEELKEETGLDIKLPIDKPGSEILYVPSSSELFTNSDTMMGAAKIFYHLGANWTLSSSLLEAANYGLLFDLDLMKRHNRRLREAALAVGASRVIMGECGHGWRAAKMYSEGANGPFPFRLTHILEYVVQHLSRFSLTKLPLRATLHDPCNYARAGDLANAPRAIVRACVEEFVEMTPRREKNFCCGGGSGLLMEEMKSIRVRLGKMKAEQIAALRPLDYIALPCASCKAQVPVLLSHYQLEGIRTGGVIDLMGKAMAIGKATGGDMQAGTSSP